MSITNKTAEEIIDSDYFIVLGTRAYIDCLRCSSPNSESVELNGEIEVANRLHKKVLLLIEKDVTESDKTYLRSRLHAIDTEIEFDKGNMTAIQPVFNKFFGLPGSVVKITGSP
jgi:hypothetical protein